MNLPDYKRILVKSNNQIAGICEKLSRIPVLGLDFETTSLDPYIGRIRLLQAASLDLLETYIFDFDYISNLEPIKEFLINPKTIKLFQNAIFDTKYCLHHLSDKTRRIYPESVLDLMLGSQLLQRFRTKEGHSLEDLALRYCSIVLDKSLQKSNWSGELSSSQIEYAAKDTEILFPISEKISEKIEYYGMEETWLVENRCVLATASMELCGIELDLDELNKLGNELDQKMALLEKKIAVFLPKKQMGLFGEEPVNLRSSTQATPALSKLFIEKIRNLDSKKAKEIGFYRQFQELEGNNRIPNTHKFIESGSHFKKECYDCGFSKLNPVHLESKKSETIKQYRPLESDLVDMLCDYGTLSQAFTTYYQGIPEYIHPITKKIHTQYFQLGQPTHRYKSTKPNLLNIPRTDGIGPDAPEKSVRNSKLSFRNAFKVPDGRRLVIADYDALQAKLVADRANEKTMIKVFYDNENNNGPDFHTATAMFTENKPKEAITKHLRQLSKSENFALIFGAGPQRLKDYLLDSFGIVLSLKECEEMIDRYFEIYHDLAEYHVRQRELVQREGKITVKGGRTVLLTEDARQKSYTIALNFPAVLSEVSGMKRAMGNIARELIQKNLDAFICIGVYDELGIDSHEDCAKEVAEILERNMISCMQHYVDNPNINITAEAKIVKRWSEK